ncbi:MAG: hypothetical protein ABF743_06510 [Schleiferilactobacillus perolens]
MTGNVLFYGLFNATIGIVLVMVNTPIQTMMQKLVPPAMQGRVFMLSGTVSSLLMPLGTLVFGALFDRLAAWLILLIAGAGTLVLVLTAMIYAQKTQLLIEYPA